MCMYIHTGTYEYIKVYFKSYCLQKQAEALLLEK